MQTKYNKISIKSYLDLNQLIDEYRGSHEENRVFALKHNTLLKNPKELLLLWMNQNIFRLRERLDSKHFADSFSSISNLFAFLSLLIGFFAGVGLLSYSGDAPVNIIYYLFVAMIIPLIGMLMTIVSMLSKGDVLNFLTLFLPLHWIEKFVSLLPFVEKMEDFNEKFSSDLKKWMFIYRLQLFSLLFSIGLFFGLLFMVATKDIAFSWSTTLSITPAGFQEFLALLSTPWATFFPSAVPSVELVELSQYYRLGEHLNPEMVQNANKLGGWWQFLALITLFYAIFLRMILLLVSFYFYKKQLDKEFFSIDGVEILLREFQTPYVSTESPNIEKHLEVKEKVTIQIKEDTHRAYGNILGWNFSDDEVSLINDSKEIKGLGVHTAGGSHTYAEDQNIAKEMRQTVLLYVKAWEPPTMDFIDFLELLIDNKKVDEIQIYPLGTIGRYYESEEKEVAVWKRKIEGLKSKKVWVIDEE
jgi:hypothetical protein